MFDLFIKDRKQVRLLQKENDGYMTGYILDFDRGNHLVKFHHLHEGITFIPVHSILHIYQPK